MGWQGTKETFDRTESFPQLNNKSERSGLEMNVKVFRTLTGTAQDDSMHVKADTTL